MKPSDALNANRETIRRVVLSNRARNPRIFGSVLYGRDTPTRDLDILVDPTPETSLLDLAAIEDELRRLLGVPIDVLTPKSLPVTFRGKVLAEAAPV